MSTPKVQAVVFCKAAVLTDPWWTLAGVFDELWLEGDGSASFDAFVKLLNVSGEADCVLRIVLVDPVSGERLSESAGISRADGSGTLERALGFDLTFPREDVYFAELWLNDMYLDAFNLRVNMIG